MPASLFKPMGRIFRTAFKDRGNPEIIWIRHDDPTPVALPALFNIAYAQVDVSGISVADAQPTAFVEVAEARRHAPDRDLKALFDNRDHVIAEGVSYRVESCEPDGQVMVEVRLTK